MKKRRRNPDRATQMQIANIIKQQVAYPQPMVFFSWGVRDFTALDPNSTRLGGLMFRVSGRRFRGIVKVELDFSDTYRVQLWRGKTMKKELDGIYADGLQQAIDHNVEGSPASRMNPRRNPKGNMMRAIRVHTRSGHSWTTNINGTNADIKRYFLGQRIDIGTAEHEKMDTVTKVDFLDDEVAKNPCGRRRRRNPAIGNDGGIFRRTAQQREVAKAAGISLEKAREMFGENFEPDQILEVFGAAQAGKIGEVETRQALAAIKSGTYGGLAVAAPAPSYPTDVGSSRTEKWKYEEIDRDTAIARIREGLKRRSGKAWSVKGGRGTAWGWIQIDAPPKRSTWGHRLKPGMSDRPENYEPYDTGKPGHNMSPEDTEELAKLLDLPKSHVRNGDSVPASTAHYWEYVDRAEGNKPRTIGKAYWD